MSIDWIIFFSGVLNVFIGWFVWRSNPKAKLNILFAVFCAVVSVQIFFDFAFRFFPTLLVLRSSYALAALIPVTASLWIFEISGIKVKKLYQYLYLAPGVLFFFLTFINGLVVKQIKGLTLLGYEGILGPIFSLYTIQFALYVISFVFIMYKAQKNAGLEKKNQLNYALAGILSYAGLAIVFSLILPIFFGIYTFTLLDAPSFIFFVGFTGYAITKHHLFNVRVVATELLTFMIWVFLLIRTLVSQNYNDLALNAAVLLFMVLAGVMLIQRTIKEVKQEEEMEKMARDMEIAYEVEREANKKLEELNKAKSQFMAAIEHHLRTPLTSMRGYAELLLSGAYGKVPKKISEVVSKFESSTKNLIEMVENFLDTTQFELGGKMIELKDKIDIAGMLKEIVGEVDLLAKNKGIYLRFDKPLNPCVIMGDSSKLKAALVNIIDNCVKYTNQGGVGVVVKRQDDKFLIKIKDTGIGIAKDRLSQLFASVFQRGAQAQKEFAQGHGIGLFLSGQIITAHKGKIWAESEGPGKGSAFFIELPAK